MTVVRTDDPDRGPWSVSTVGYFYEVLERDGNELFAYHWHPGEAGTSWAKFPHLHISGRGEPLPLGTGLTPVALGALHFPTDRVAFEAVIRILLKEFEVPPRRPEVSRPGRLGWAELLDRNEAVFRAGRTR